MKKIFLVLICAFTLYFIFNFLFTNQNHDNFIKDNYSMKVLEYEDFKEAVLGISEEMRDSTSFVELDKYVFIAKSSNTIAVYKLAEKDIVFKDFQNLCNRKWILQVVKKLHAKESWGMGFYSKEYDMMIGGMLLDNKKYYFELKGYQLPK